MLTNAVLAILLLSTFANSTLTPKSPKVAKQNAPKSKANNEKGLIVENPQTHDILENYKSHSKKRKNNFHNLILGYVTPWNSHGYDIAKLFAHKFTHISPVWLQIKPTDKEFVYEITGIHDIDQNWMKNVKESGSQKGTKIVPRVLFEGWQTNDYISLLTNKKAVEQLVKTLLNCAKKWPFDGFVLELWSQLGGRVKDNLLNDLIKTIGKDLWHKNQLDLILAIPPKRNDDIFTADDFADLQQFVTAFSLMTYDFSNVHRPGPNAPINWVKDCITSLTTDKEFRSKILTGLNFYGNQYSASGGGPIISHEYLNLLRKFKGTLQYDEKSAENFFEVKESDGKHLVFYPTLYSIQKRISLADDMSTGLSIWELGQGLDYFYDLL